MDSDKLRSAVALRTSTKSLEGSPEASFVQYLDTLSPTRLANLFVDLALIRSRLELTLENKTDRKMAALAARKLKILSTFVQSENEEDFRIFARAAMKQMETASREDSSLLSSEKSDSIYRAFDAFDDMLGVEYKRDLGMSSEAAQTERLYEGAGVGVQTSYSSILLALAKANPKQGATVLDLGSGYGRVGFVIGLLRPDIDFIGYEYVDHRVQNARDVAEAADLTRVHFLTQDLSLPDFKIPKADVYYMYDPFSRETYGYVLDQLIKLGASNPITIITKGRANTWVKDALANHAWSMDDSCDSGTVTLFRSPSVST